MRYFWLAVACGAVWAAPVLAQDNCVTRDDLVGGIRIDFADGRVETYRTIGPDRINVLGIEGGQPSFELELIKGFHLASVVFYSDGVLDEFSRDTYIYDVPVQDLPVPTGGGRFSVGVTVQASDGTQFDEPQLQAYVDVDPMMINGCTYTAMDAVVAYDTPDDYIETVRYFPQLGFGYLLNNVVAGDLSSDNFVTRMSAVQ